MAANYLQQILQQQKEQADQQAAAQAQQQPDAGGFFGWHPPKFGLGELVSGIAHIPGALFNAGAGLATGNPKPALGMLGAVANAVPDVLDLASFGLASPVTGPIRSGIGAVTGFTPPSIGETIRHQGILPGLAQGLGDVSLAGAAAGKLLSIGELGTAGAAEAAAARAAAGGASEADIAQAANVAKAARGLAPEVRPPVPEVVGTVPPTPPPVAPPEPVLPISGRAARSATKQAMEEAGIGPGRVRQAGIAAAKAAAEATGDVMDEQAVAARAHTLDVLHQVAHPYRSVAENVLRPLGRAALAENAEPLAESIGVPKAPSTPADLAPPIDNPPVNAAAEAVLRAHSEAATHFHNAMQEAGLGEAAGLPEEVPEGHTRMFRGEPNDGTPPGLMFHQSKDYARQFMPEGGHVIGVDVPNDVAEEAAQAAQAGGHVGHELPPEYASKAIEVPSGAQKVFNIGEEAAAGKPALPSQEAVLPPARGEKPPPILPEAAHTNEWHPTPGPVEAASRRVAGGDIPQWAADLVARSPVLVKNILGKIGGIDAKLQMARIFREIARSQDAARRQILHGDEIQNMVKAASEHLVDRALPDGRVITPTMANDLMGDTIMAKVTHIEALQDIARRAAPDEVARIDKVMEDIGARSADRIPLNWLQTPDGIPTALGEAVGKASDDVRTMAANRLETLRSSTKGNLGLEEAELRAPQLSIAAQKLLTQAQKELESARYLMESKIPKEQERARAIIARMGDQQTKLGERIKDLRGAGLLAVQSFNRSREYMPAAFKNDATWIAAREMLADLTVQNGGGTFNVHQNRMLKPLGMGGTDRGFAVGAIPGSADVVALTGDAAADKLALTRSIDRVGRAYQELFQNPRVHLGTWVDGNQMAHIDVTELVPTRDEALIKGAARRQESIFDFQRNPEDAGAFPVPPGRPDVAAQFLNENKQRTRYAGELRRAFADINAQRVSRGLKPLVTEEALDQQMAVNDIMAVTQRAAQPERFRSADSVYGTMGARFRQRVAGLPEDALIMRRNDELTGDFLGATVAGDNRNIMHFFSDADPVSLAHQHALALRQILGRDDMARLESLLNIKDGHWGVAQQSRFARLFETYLATGKAEGAGLSEYFGRIRATLGEVYRVLRADRGRAVPADFREVFDRWFDPQKALISEADVLPALPPLDWARSKITPEGVYHSETLSEAQRAQSTPLIPELRTPEAYSRGIAGGRAIEAAKALEQKAAELESRRIRLGQNMEKMRQSIEMHALPSEILAARANAKANRLLGKVAATLDNPTLGNVPEAYKPIWKGIQSLHKAAEDVPELEPVINELPQTWDTVLRIAAEQGFEPSHIRDFSRADVQRLIRGNVLLGGGDLSREMTAGTRLQRRGAGFGRARSVEALAAASVEASQEVRRNGMVRYVDDVWSHDIPADGYDPKRWRPWDATRRMLTSGTKDQETGRITVEGMNYAPKKMIPKEVADLLDSYNNTHDHPLWNTLRKDLDPWRAFLLTFSPHWYVSTFVSHLGMMLKEGVNWNDFKEAWAELRKGGVTDDASRWMRKFGPGADAFKDMQHVLPGTIANEFEPAGIIPYPKGMRGVQMAAGESMRHAFDLVTSRLRLANETVDEFARVAVYKHGLRTGMTEQAALQRTYNALVDYANLNPFERQVVRSIIPFYTFQKGILKLTSRFAFDHPYVLGIGQLMTRMNADIQRQEFGGELPRARAGLLPIPGIGALDLGILNPLRDAPQLTTPQGIAASMNPIVSVAIRNAFGAPAPGSPEIYRVDDFGRKVPDTSPMHDFQTELTSMPQARLAGALAGNGNVTQAAAATIGASTYAPEQVNNMMTRNEQAEGILPKTRKARAPKKPALPAQHGRLPAAVRAKKPPHASLLP